MKQNKTTSEMPEMLSAKDMSEHLGISIASCYKLLKQDDFPTTQIGKRRVVSRDRLNEWLEKNTRGNKK
ncbi:MAG TPA: helix-turn-helix domain-containing protein [Ruminococcus flavefaciens]|nr:helix-turn-helix domain-containing protein [Ruminococcus flavefaciens]